VAAALIKGREATEAPQTGWSLTHNVAKRILEHPTKLTTPSAPSKVASQHSLHGASTPPHEEGNMKRGQAVPEIQKPTTHIFKFLDKQRRRTQHPIYTLKSLRRS
jgi:hypothetical protein